MGLVCFFLMPNDEIFLIIQSTTSNYDVTTNYLVTCGIFFSRHMISKEKQIEPIQDENNLCFIFIAFGFLLTRPLKITLFELSTRKYMNGRETTKDSCGMLPL